MDDTYNAGPPDGFSKEHASASMMRLDAARVQPQRRESSGTEATRQVNALEAMYDKIETLIMMRNTLWSQGKNTSGNFLNRQILAMKAKMESSFDD